VGGRQRYEAGRGAVATSAAKRLVRMLIPLPAMSVESLAGSRTPTLTRSAPRRQGSSRGGLASWSARRDDTAVAAAAT